MADRMMQFLSYVPRGTTRLPSSSTSGAVSCLPINDDTLVIFNTLDSIKKEAAELDKLHVNQLIECGNELRERVNASLERIRACSHACRQLIENYRQVTEQFVSQGRLGSSQLQMRRNVHSYMELLLMNAVRSVWDAQEEQEGRLIDVTARRVKVRIITSGGAPISEADTRKIAQQLVDTGNEDRLFSLARDELERVMRTRNVVLELEQGMRDLLHLFSDLHFLIMEQSESLVEVQGNVKRAEAHLEAGMKEWRKAKSHQRACCCAM